jgi:hypothetical protein
MGKNYHCTQCSEDHATDLSSHDAATDAWKVVASASTFTWAFYKLGHYPLFRKLFLTAKSDNLASFSI